MRLPNFGKVQRSSLTFIISTVQSWMVWKFIPPVDWEVLFYFQIKVISFLVANVTQSSYISVLFEICQRKVTTWPLRAFYWIITAIIISYLECIKIGFKNNGRRSHGLMSPDLSCSREMPSAYNPEEGALYSAVVASGLVQVEQHYVPTDWGHLTAEIYCMAGLFHQWIFSSLMSDIFQDDNAKIGRVQIVKE